MNLAPVLRQRFLDANGEPLVGGKLYTYEAGTTTLQATYTDSTGATPNANPVVLDANGEASVWLDPDLSYKFVLRDANDVLQFTTDNVAGLLAADAVATASLQNGAVTTAKLADDSVTADKLKDSVATDSDRAVTSNHIRNSAILRRMMGAGAVAKQNVSTKTANYTATSDDDHLLCDATSGAFTVTLPAAATNSGMILKLIKTDSSFNAITIDGNGSETVGGSTTTTLDTQGESLEIICDGSNWHIVRRYIPSAWTAYTPSFNGFGTPSSVVGGWTRVGDRVRIHVAFTAGTVTASEARVNLPAGLGISSTKWAGGYQHSSGVWVRNAASNVERTIVGQPGNGYVNFIDGSGGLTVLTGSSACSTGERILVFAEVPVTGWNG